MIERHSDVPDNIVELDRHDTVGDYARTYGTELARLYEDLNILVIPHLPLDLDLTFLQALSFPDALEKVGTRNGIEASVVSRSREGLNIDPSHILVRVSESMKHAAFIQAQIASLNGQIRAALHALFPMYYSLREFNITWRFTETEEGDLHLDTFGSGQPVEEQHRHHRLKMFLNIDTEPRHWETSYTLPDVLKHARAGLPGDLPNDINVINHLINTSGAMSDFPYHRIAYPQMSAVLGNAEAVTHKVKSGRRMIACEFLVEPRDMLDPAKNTHTQLPGWLGAAGIGVRPNS